MENDKEIKHHGQETVDRLVDSGNSRKSPDSYRPKPPVEDNVLASPEIMEMEPWYESEDEPKISWRDFVQSIAMLNSLGYFVEPRMEHELESCEYEHDCIPESDMQSPDLIRELAGAMHDLSCARMWNQGWRFGWEENRVHRQSPNMTYFGQTEKEHRIMFFNDASKRLSFLKDCTLNVRPHIAFVIGSVGLESNTIKDILTEKGVKYVNEDKIPTLFMRKENVPYKEVFCVNCGKESPGTLSEYMEREDGIRIIGTGKECSALEQVCALTGRPMDGQLPFIAANARGGIDEMMEENRRAAKAGIPEADMEEMFEIRRRDRALTGFSADDELLSMVAASGAREPLPGLALVDTSPILERFDSVWDYMHGIPEVIVCNRQRGLMEFRGETIRAAMNGLFPNTGCPEPTKENIKSIIDRCEEIRDDLHSTLLEYSVDEGSIKELFSVGHTDIFSVGSSPHRPYEEAAPKMDAHLTLCVRCEGTRAVVTATDREGLVLHLDEAVRLARNEHARGNDLGRLFRERAERTAKEMSVNGNLTNKLQ